MANPTKKIIGERIPQVLAALEGVQPCSSWELAKLLADIAPENVHKYATRAADLGLATVDHRGRPKMFAVVTGWRDLVATRNLADGVKTVTVPLEVQAPVRGFYRLPAAAVMPPSLAAMHPLYTVWR